VAEILSTALIRYDAYGRPQKRVSVVVDAKTRTLIATGDPKELQGASVIIEQLDASLGTQPARQMKVLQVKAGRVADLSSKVRQLYNDQIKTQPDLGLADALILDDTASNQLILAGSEEQIQLIERIVKELQNSQASEESRVTRIFDLAQSEDIQRLTSMVQGLYQEHWKTKEASDPPDAQIMPDSKNARLVVTGRTNHLAEIASILQQLTAPSTNNEVRETRVYDLNTSTAGELSTTVNMLYRE
jgi:type II secretory pathway component GspD/PulD (secretin)